MKRIIKLIALSSFFMAGVVLAKTDRFIQKNYMQPRDQLSNLAMKTVNWHYFYNAKPDGKYSGTVQVTPFYQKSAGKYGVGKYFGFVNDNPLLEGQPREQNYIGVKYNDPEYLLDPRDIIHEEQEEAEFVGRFKFEPYQEIWAARFDWHQDLDELINGLFFEISTPLVSVKNNMNLTDMEAGHPEELINGKEVTLRDYFSGNISTNGSLTGEFVQLPLKYARMAGGNTTGGFADVEIDLGYQLFYKKNFRLSFNGAVIVPTGNQPKAINRFEPIYGSGDHWALGFGIDTDLTFWKSKDDNKHIKALLLGNYRFYFKSTEKRTPTFKDENGKSKLEYMYLLGGEKGERKVFPLANVLTQDLNIEPGSQVELLAALNFKWKRWHLDAGYNLFARESEVVEFKHTWNNYKYAVAAYDYDTSIDFDLNTNIREGFKTITDSDIDLTSVKQPSQTTHKVYGGLAYECKRWKYPTMFGLGGHYEWARTNASLETWALWLKASLAY